jgi:hypothetical protein
MKNSDRLLAGAAVAVIGLALVSPALGADAADWIKPASDGAESLTDSLIQIGAPILGLCIAGFGAWAVMTNHLDFRRLWMFLLGGALIGVAKPFGSWFMGLFGS